MSNEPIVSADRAHVFHSWSAQRDLAPIPVAGGAGSVFWDHEGNEYLDFASQLVNLNLGHQHPRMVEAITEQANRLCMIAPQFANETRNEAARRIVEHAPGDLSHVFFTNGGAESIEHAVRMARVHTGRSKVLSTYRSYHGATGGAITVTGEPRRWDAEPGMPGVVHFFGPYPYRSSFGATSDEEECARALAHLEEVVAVEGPPAVAAIVLETVAGANGVLVPPDGYLQGVRELCDRHGILLICDEVMVGFGRTGRWFAVDHWDVAPDLIAFAKGVNSGYVPLGGVLISRRVVESFMDRPYPGGLTYSGHPLACAAAVESIRILEEDGLVERAADLGVRILAPRLAEIADRHPSVGEVRGVGLFWAVELVRDRATREMFVPFNAKGADAAPMAAVVEACRRAGMWPFSAANRIHLAPPLVISEDELERGLGILDQALHVADGFLG